MAHPDKLTNQILNSSLELINWNTDIRFFNTYISNLDLFLDSNKLKDSIKRRKKNDSNYSLNKYKNDRPAEFINQEIWKAWEWLLFLMRQNSEFEDKWLSTLKDRTLTKGLDKRLELHQYLRMNNSESVFTNVVEKHVC